MTRADPPRPGHDHTATGLQVLVDLINETLGRWVVPPRIAGAAEGPMHSVRPMRPSRPVLSSALDSPAPSPSAGVHGRASRALKPVRATETDTPADADADSTTDLAIDSEHVETWRLVHLAQDGDGEAFGMLYDRYVDSVFRFIYYRVNDRALAEDFTSETFVRALRRIGSISYQGRDIGAWFVTIARNIVLDHVKSARHRLETSTGETIEGPDRAPSTESAVLDSLASERLMQAVAMLGEEQRECVMLRFMQGLSVTETAAVMGKNDGAIKALQHRAVRKLADLIGDDLR